MPEELPRPHHRLDLRPHLRQASHAPAREEPRPPRRSNERRSTTSRKTNMVPPREASSPVASGLPPARFGDHERAPPPSSLPGRCPATCPPFPVLLSLMASLSLVCLQEPSWTSPQASAAVAGRLHPVLVENRTPANSSSQIRPSPSSSLPAASMPTLLTCCNLHGWLPLFLRFRYGVFNLVQISNSVGSSCENPFVLAQLLHSLTSQLVGLQPGDPGFEFLGMQIFVFCNLSLENELLTPFHLLSRPSSFTFQ